MIQIAPYGKSELLPLEITAQARHTNGTYGFSPASVQGSIMSREQRMLLCVALQAVAEQDMQNVVSQQSGKRALREKQRVSEEAKEYVASEEFRELCKAVGLRDLYGLLRFASPSKAKIALDLLSNPGTDLAAATRAVLEMQEQTLPTF